jgi:hypothetical protein
MYCPTQAPLLRLRLLGCHCIPPRLLRQDQPPRGADDADDQAKHDDTRCDRRSVVPPQELPQPIAGRRWAGQHGLVGQKTLHVHGQVVGRLVAPAALLGKRHPPELGLADASCFLEHVVRTEKQPLPALETARSALELLFGTVLGIDLGELPRPPRLLDQMSQVLRVRHYSPRTEACYLRWARQFILFHGKRRPRDLGAARVEQFLTHLAVKGRVSASTQNQTLSALVFLYQEVLEIDLGRFQAVRARRPKRLPVVSAAEKVAAVSERVEGDDGAFPLMARLPYDCTLRFME